jgi:TPR repeat protein
MLGRGIGVRKNGPEAIDMLLASAEQDYALAHYSAGIFYIEGITAADPLRPSVREACYHLRSAAVLDYEKAEKAQKTYCKFD